MRFQRALRRRARTTPHQARRHGALMISLAGLRAAGYFAFHSVGEDESQGRGNQPRASARLPSFEPMKSRVRRTAEAITNRPPRCARPRCRRRRRQRTLSEGPACPAGDRQQPARRSARPSCKLLLVPKRRVRTASPRLAIEAACDHSGRHQGDECSGILSSSSPWARSSRAPCRRRWIVQRRALSPGHPARRPWQHRVRRADGARHQDRGRVFQPHGAGPESHVRALEPGGDA